MLVSATVASGAGGLGAAAVLGLGAWGGRPAAGQVGALQQVRPLLQLAGQAGELDAAALHHVHVVGQPRVVLLDEPAAGLPDEETQHLGRMISRIPEQRGALVILVDHDMSLVSACCEVTAVLDFGKLIAAGPTAQVLRDEKVVAAYLGAEDVAA